MKEYIERSAVMQKFADYVKRSNNSDFALIPTWNEAVLIVEECPTVDAVEVVRCKHCRWRPSNSDFNVCPYSVRSEEYPFHLIKEPDPNGYCHLGEWEVDDN